MTHDELIVWHALSNDPACLLLIPAVIALEQHECMEIFQ